MCQNVRLDLSKPGLHAAEKSAGASGEATQRGGIVHPPTVGGEQGNAWTPAQGDGAARRGRATPAGDRTAWWLFGGEGRFDAGVPKRVSRDKL